MRFKMLKQSKQLGWGDEREVCEFFGLRRSDVRQLADSGKWPFVTVQGKRLFDVDLLLRTLVQQGISGETEDEHRV